MTGIVNRFDIDILDLLACYDGDAKIAQQYVDCGFMPIIQAYQCPRTGKLFADKELYLIHLRSLAKANLLNKIEARLKRSMAREFHTMRMIATLTELQNWIIEHSYLFYLNQKMNGFDWDKPLGPKPGLGKIHDVRFFIRLYNEKCSNTHASPLGKPRNWHRDDSIPTSYPGWRGRITIRCDDRPGFLSDMFRGTGINIGTGGGGEYDVILFTEDWPGLASTAMMRKLAGSNSSDIL